MTDSEILSVIAAVAREHVGYDGPLTPQMSLVEDLELDSLKSLTLAVEIENRFQICLDPAREEGMVTVGDLLNEVRRLVEYDHQ